MNKLAILLLLCASAVRADTYQVASPYVGFAPTFDLPHGTQFIVGTELDIIANWKGGTLNGTIYVADAQLDGVMQLSTILSYPAGFTIDPTLYAEQQWPFDVWAYMPAGVDLAHPLAITTPEPATGVLVLLVGLLVGLKRLLWKG